MKRRILALIFTALLSACTTPGFGGGFGIGNGGAVIGIGSGMRF